MRDPTRFGQTAPTTLHNLRSTTTRTNPTKLPKRTAKHQILAKSYCPRQKRSERERERESTRERVRVLERDRGREDVLVVDEEERETHLEGK